MTTTYNQQSRSGGGSLLLLLILFAALAFFALQSAVGVVDFTESHGVKKHGISAVQIRKCLENNGPLRDWVNPVTGRRARVCEVEPGRFGVQILEFKDGAWREITAFAKDKMRSLDQVLRYLSNRGYMPPQ